MSTTYPNYVFVKAYAAYRNTLLQEYVVIINANNTILPYLASSNE